MIHKFTIRLPEKLDIWLKQLAQKSERSLNRQVIFLLEKERSADLLAERCIGNIHVFENGRNQCTCGLKVDRAAK